MHFVDHHHAVRQQRQQADGAVAVLKKTKKLMHGRAENPPVPTGQRVQTLFNQKIAAGTRILISKHALQVKAG